VHARHETWEYGAHRRGCVSGWPIMGALDLSVVFAPVIRLVGKQGGLAIPWQEPEIIEVHGLPRLIPFHKLILLRP